MSSRRVEGTNEHLWGDSQDRERRGFFFEICLGRRSASRTARRFSIGTSIRRVVNDTDIADVLVSPGDQLHGDQVRPQNHGRHHAGQRVLRASARYARASPPQTQYWADARSRAWTPLAKTVSTREDVPPK
jgi:hypothetical protein